MLRIRITLIDGVNIPEIDPFGQELYEGIHLDPKQRLFIYVDYFILELRYALGEGKCKEEWANLRINKFH